MHLVRQLGCGAMEQPLKTLLLELLVPTLLLFRMLTDVPQLRLLKQLQYIVYPHRPLPELPLLADRFHLLLPAAHPIHGTAEAVPVQPLTRSVAPEPIRLLQPLLKDVPLRHLKPSR